jgi:hypothetical protein
MLIRHLAVDLQACGSVHCTRLLKWLELALSLGCTDVHIYNHLSQDRATLAKAGFNEIIINHAANLAILLPMIEAFT